jgi:2-amino-4-hydroxy-6-hydroxymethyldihydropteridine diphosphokinase
MTARAFVAIGSNLGDRLTNCHLAIKRMAEMPDTRLEQTSPIIETKPAEGAAGGPFLNLVVELSTELSPEMLLRHLQAIEVDLDRKPDHSRLDPRTIDLDIVLFSGVVVNTPELAIPHPRLALRRFVLEPLAAIAPDVLHPTLGLTIRELFQRLEDQPQTQNF